MKKLSVFLVVLLSFLVLPSCNSSKTIVVSATTVPHAQILEFAKPFIKEKGYDLKILETDDYDIPNAAVANKSADANYFQHVPYFDLYNSKQTEKKKLVNAGAIHIEPIGLFSPTGAKHRNTLADIQDGDTVLMSNNTPETARLLNLLAAAGLITLTKSHSLDVTLADIATNPKNLDIKTNVSPELLVQAYQNGEANLVLINGNYALAGGLNPKTQSLYLESTQDNPYANIIAVRQDNQDSAKIRVLLEVLTSQAVKDFINTTYDGSVIPAV